jgi:hypothetical protein
MLLRLTFTEPVRERAEWLAKHPMAAHWTLPRYRWRQDTKGTDWATCAWMIWPSPGAPVAYGHLGHGVLLKRRPIVTIPRKDAASR